MQLLRDNLTLWTSDMQDGDKDKEQTTAAAAADASAPAEATKAEEAS